MTDDKTPFRDDARVSEDVLRQAALSDRLREMFADVLEEPVPDEFATLLARLRQDRTL